MLTAALAFAGAAAAGYGNGGVTPLSSPSPSAHSITRDYYLVAGVTFAIFLLVEGLLVAFIIRYRSRGRPRTAEGYQIHGANRLELAWTAAPALILAGIVTFVLLTFQNVASVPKADAAGGVENITVIGHQFYWEFRYPNGAFSVNTMYAPAGKTVALKVITPPNEVNHSWWIPQLDGKIDAIPGRINHTWFRVDRTGTFSGQCAELCGIQHAQMTAQVVVQTQQQYAATTSRLLAQLNGASPQLGKQMFDGVCERCHRISGPTFIGPTLGGNPLLADYKSLFLLVHQGRTTSLGTMPPVGAGWTEQQVRTLVAYTKSVASGGAG